jgi:hypothetical protein
MGNRGKREFIQVLRLMEIFPESTVAAAALDAIRSGAISFDAVKQLIIAKVERRPARLDLHVHTGAQAIVGSVSQSGGGRDNDENRGQPHAPENAGAITFAPGTALPSADEARDTVPVASSRR